MGSPGSLARVYRNPRNRLRRSSRVPGRGAAEITGLAMEKCALTWKEA